MKDANVDTNFISLRSNKAHEAPQRNKVVLVRIAVCHGNVWKLFKHSRSSSIHDLKCTYIVRFSKRILWLNLWNPLPPIHTNNNVCIWEEIVLSFKGLDVLKARKPLCEETLKLNLNSQTYDWTGKGVLASMNHNRLEMG